jgi:hypothetical protein
MPMLCTMSPTTMEINMRLGDRFEMLVENAEGAEVYIGEQGTITRVDGGALYTVRMDSGSTYNFHEASIRCVDASAATDKLPAPKTGSEAAAQITEEIANKRGAKLKSILRNVMETADIRAQTIILATKHIKALESIKADLITCFDEGNLTEPAAKEFVTQITKITCEKP